MTITDTSRQFWAALEYLFERSDYPNQEALAITAGVSQSTISEMLRKKRSFSAKIQAKVAEAFGIDLIDMLSIGRDLAAGKIPDLSNSPKWTMKSLDAYQLSIVGEMMRSDPELRIAVYVDDQYMYVADIAQTRFEAGKLFMVEIDGNRSIMSALELDGKTAIASNYTCIVVDKWGPPKIIGKVILRAERID